MVNKSCPSETISPNRVFLADFRRGADKVVPGIDLSAAKNGKSPAETSNGAEMQNVNNQQIGIIKFARESV